jgi:hypothetical protein
LKSDRRPPDTCPNCGADLPPNAVVCPECGSDESTGWSENAASQGLNLPDEDFDYDEFAKREFGEDEQIKPAGISWLWWIVAALVVIALIWLLLKA